MTVSGIKPAVTATDSGMPGARERQSLPQSVESGGVPENPQYVVNVDVTVVRDGAFLCIERGADEEHAPGALGFPGGTVEPADGGRDVLETTAHREVREEVGVDLADPMVYVQSNAFEADFGGSVLNVLFLCRHAGGEADATADEVAATHWLTAEAVADHPETPAYTRRQVELSERRRRELGW